MEEKLIESIVYEIALLLNRKGIDCYFAVDRLLAVLKRYDPSMEFKVHPCFVSLTINGEDWTIPTIKNNEENTIKILAFSS